MITHLMGGFQQTIFSMTLRLFYVGMGSNSWEALA